MADKSKTKQKLASKLARLRKQGAESEKLKAECKHIDKKLNKYQEHLEESEQKFKIIFENTMDGILIVDMESKKFLMGNKTICRKLGYSKEEIKNMEVINLHLKKDLPYILDRFESQGKEGFTPTQSVPIKKKGGSVFYADINATPITLAGKRYLMGTFRDITKRKKMEEELQETKRQIEFVLGHTKTGLDIIDSQFNVRYIDPEWQKIYGDYTGKKCYEYFMGRKEVCPNCSIPKALATKKPIISEEILFKENNRPIQVTTIPFQDKNSEWLVAEVNVDITERKRLESIMKASEEKFRSVVDNIAIGVALISPKMEILTLNKKMKEWFPNVDVNKKPICYRSFNNPPREEMCSYCPTYKTLNDGQIHESVTDTPIGGNKIINYRIVSSPIIDDNGKIIAAIEMVEDITERQKIDEKLKLYQEHLKELVEKRTYELEMVNKKIQQEITACNVIGKELRESEERYKDLWDNAPVSYHILDIQGIIKSVNKTEAKMLGYKPKEMIGKPIFDFILPEQQEEAKKRFYEKVTGGHIAKAERRIYVKNDGSMIYVSINDVLEYDNDGKIIGIKTIMVDVTESKKMEEALQESELQYKTTINSMRDAIHVVNADLKIILYNESLQKWLNSMGLKAELSQQVLFEVIPFLSDKVRSEYKQVFESGETLVTEENISFAGKEWITEVRKIPIEENNKIIRVLTIIRDITERQKTEETIRHLAYHDILTNLPNRALFNNRLALELNRAQRHKQKASVMLMDLDRFKKINDTLGHSLGDQLLQSVGKRLSEIVRSSDTVARMGGDEFILLLPETYQTRDITRIAQKILKAIKEPFFVSGIELKITTSIGISIYPTHGEDAETLIKNADIAMYQAKKAGRNNFLRYKANSK